jgi:2,3-bisphosphoglycerate-independent phosphoglycerate mutase
MILDGWENPLTKVSAIDNANIPFINSLYKTSQGLLQTDGLNVGFAGSQMGNSEVGHMNLGAGRIVSRFSKK